MERLACGTWNGLALEWRDLIERFKDREHFPELPDWGRSLYIGGALQSLGVVEAHSKNSKVHAIAEELESLGSCHFKIAASQVLASYHLHRGESRAAAQYQDKVEQHAVETGTIWQVEMWASLSKSLAYSNWRDVVALRHNYEQLQHQCGEVKSLQNVANATHGIYQLFRGNFEQAIQELEGLLGSMEPNSQIGWLGYHGYLAEAYNAVGAHTRALETCEQVAAYCQEMRTCPVLNIGLDLAQVEATYGLGDASQARAMLSQLMELHSKEDNPLIMGKIARTDVLIARHEGDDAAARSAVQRMRTAFESTENPTLIAQAEALAVSNGARQCRFDERISEEVNTVRLRVDDLEVPNLVLTSVNGLELMARQSNADSGYLFLCGLGYLELVARFHAQPPPQWIENAVESWVSNLRRVQSDFSFTQLRTPDQRTKEQLGVAVEIGEDSSYYIAVLDSALELTEPTLAQLAQSVGPILHQMSGRSQDPTSSPSS